MISSLWEAEYAKTCAGPRENTAALPIWFGMAVSRSGFHAWLNRSPSKRALEDGALLTVMRRSFTASDRTYEAR